MLKVIGHIRGGSLAIQSFLMLALFMTMINGPVGAVPQLNGLFFGDGDNSEYTELYTDIATQATAYYYLDHTNNDLYIACVVSTDINDNVFADNNFPTGDVTYLRSVNWSQGAGQAKDHSLDKLITSDRLEIRLTVCGQAWEWSQDYVYDSDANPENSNWLSDYLGTDGSGTPPSGVQSNSSLQYNLNNSTWDPTAGGKRGIGAGGKYEWISPATLDVNGFPTDTPSDNGWNTYNSIYDWEWPLVYEMRIPLTEEQMNCPIGIEFLTAHNSPSKTGNEDAPVLYYDYGDAPDSYGTLLASDGPRHNIPINANLYLGSIPDGELDGQPTTNADGDDINGSSADDEDGVTLPAVIGVGDVITIPVEASADGVLNAWIDWNGNGVFDAGEALTVGGSSDINVTAGTNNISVTVPADAVAGVTYARFRLSSNGGLSPTGYAPDGEVEDYKIEISRTDYGDAPFDGSLYHYGSASHTIAPSTSPIQMGSSIDGDPNYAGDPNANIDDINDGTDDEDGIRFYKQGDGGTWIQISGTEFKRGETYKVEVDAVLGANESAKLAAWFDFYPTSGGTLYSFDNEDQIINNETVTNNNSTTATVTFSQEFTIPAGADPTTTYIRFRIDSGTSNLSPTGAGTGYGEVEDYATSLGDTPPIKVSLTAFTATRAEHGVVVQWQAASEINHAGYNVYRSMAAESGFEKINSTLITTATTTSGDMASYEYMDTAASSTTYYYKLEDVSLDGERTWHGPVQATVSSSVADQVTQPRTFALQQNYPNPFNPITTISYSVPEPSHVVLEIYNIQGTKVRTLVNRMQTAGAYTVTWDATDEWGGTLGGGSYLYKFTAGDFSQVRRMTLLK